ncbi:hydantoinase/oxoprolinase N-terminal domain-containing protein [Seohaeicola zhoushanensis]|uniref:Hydantoinase n=1 Tax=Seohaeicola zhoushanensis TaxID=1569283 RepID=A0A8J3GV35_9RHOB|nr:hydantoinase/oxoprolinase family protein [Seohaeicola zhoushanensis]GHF38276.1 hydantoinase [Seohaeicola zhoushanensis]
MAILLGVDTGGTYTDAVLLRDETEVIASAKALTTRHDLAIGVGGAVRAVLEQSGVLPGEIALASLSTTLATNALVEGQGGRVALVYVGFAEGDLEAHGLTEVLRGDPSLVLAGGHNHAGAEAVALDLDALDAFLEAQAGKVSAFAVAALFATRNPAHELAVAERIRARTAAPVTCSHQLSARLNGPKRALTAVLNARLVGMIDRLIGRAQDTLVDLGIGAPMMVVRGDGAMMSAEQARMRPIETILSGPAASLVGARWLTGAETAMVSDIGGTTTDVAMLKDGRPAIDPAGAQVGGMRTMVEAVAMRTTGLGGDSQIQVNAEGLAGGIRLGPRRVVPVSLIAMEAPDVVHRALDAQLRAPVVGEHDTRFLRAVPGVARDGLGAREIALLERIGEGVHPLGEVLKNRMEQGALGRLVDRGIVQMAGPTPSDASHVLGRLDDWDSEAARKAMEQLARRRTGSGNRLAADAESMARIVIDQLTEQTVQALLETAFAEEAEPFETAPELLAKAELIRRGLAGHRGIVALDAGLNVDVIGLGASAASYYPAVGERLRCRMVLPQHAGVANAIGAVVGRVTMRRSGTVTSPTEGRYRVYLAAGPQDLNSAEAALALLEAELRAEAEAEALAAGAEGLQVVAHRDVKSARTEAREVFIEATVTVEASGRPRVAVG